jgi:hypothetical protein
MPEVTIKYKNAKTLRALNDFAKYFDFIIQKPKSKKKVSHSAKQAELPIDFADDPDVTALAGIWKGRDISINDLRQKAWGNT